MKTFFTLVSDLIFGAIESLVTKKKEVFRFGKRPIFARLFTIDWKSTAVNWFFMKPFRVEIIKCRLVFPIGCCLILHSAVHTLLDLQFCHFFVSWNNEVVQKLVTIAFFNSNHLINSTELSLNNSSNCLKERQIIQQIEKKTSNFTDVKLF